MKVGRDPLKDDIERIKVIRSALGDDFRIMVDANCAFDEAEALRRGRAYEKLDVFWFEEPIQPYERDGHARLCSQLDISIAAGENYYTRHQFYDVIKAGCADIIQPDNRRAGGVTEWLDIGAICDVTGKRLASHGGSPGNVNVLCALESAIYIESGSLKNENTFHKTPLAMKDGELLIPEVPGMGCEVHPEYISKYRIT
jgi:L-alanine-DL-glutamate epimerase-like enolase superfamily enzyme